MTLIREDATALYQQIAATLRDEMERGVYEPTGRLPSETELGARFGVSRVTVRLAIGSLDEAGLVERKQGKGTFATKRRLRHRLDVLRGFYDSLARQGVTVKMELLRLDECEVPPGLREAFTANVERCVYLERLHRVDDEPVALAQTCLLPEASVTSRAEAETLPSYEMIERVAGWRIADAEMTVTAVAAQRGVAEHLGVAAGAPLLVMRRTTRLDDGRVCESTVFHIRPERYEFVVTSGVEGKLVR
ncbi:GntR family transcriptional regulator [Burkholderia sp. Ac-20379]|uniref:GntR family transcriptional regulator n=1 Tax=Burkholderia sp. Ac-20379 TaxID=2703900 RepID=UPI001981A38B|nr:GntR family transcriptional regulator [Burkholderia sp. Ac-20379]MBN3725317.1 GntR family transcriptional regulator [Burkholderia sp. Ac-20379]